MKDWLGWMWGGGNASHATDAPAASITTADLLKMIAADSPVSAKDAMRNSAINRCVNLIAGAIGQLPFQLMENDPSGSGGNKAVDHPLYALLKQKPNHWQSASTFKRQMQRQALTKGNAYALPIRLGSTVREFIPLAPEYMKVEQAEDWTVRYVYAAPNRAVRTFKPSEIIHLMGPSDNGLMGEAMTDVARDVLNTSRTADKSIQSMMKRGARPGGSLSTDGKLTQEAAERLRDDFHEKYSGVDNEGKWMVLEQGLTATPFTTSSRDLQGVELRAQQVEEVARLFGVPRPLLMLSDTSWGSGIEQLAIFFVVYALGPWFTLWEEEFALKLLNERERERYYFKFNERALLRGSMKDQGEFFAKLLGSGGSPQVITANEARGMMDMAAHPDGNGLSAGAMGAAV